MFGEGIDIPNLKIAAIHDKYKSLPITIQFIGRIARKTEKIGPATVITNIANDDLNESLNELYKQDSDWNQLLEHMSMKQISKVEELQNIVSRFDESVINGIDIKQLKLKISMVAFKITESDWNISKLQEQLNNENTSIRVNNSDRIIVIVQRVESNVEWINFKGITDINWELSVLYWNTDNNILFINSSNKLNVFKYANSLFKNPIKIQGETIFKCLYDIKRLMLSTVGLKTAIDGPIRYKMFAGIDVADGISESQKISSIKSNIFGVGYNGNGKISIGCSHKGTIWSKWVESLDYWINWCNDQSKKLLNETIESSEFLKGALVPIAIYERPKVIAYGIDWPVEFELINEEVDCFEYLSNSYSLIEMDIRIEKFNDEGPIVFKIFNNYDIDINYSFTLIENSFQISTSSNDQLYLKIGKSTTNIITFFNENPPRIKFTDQSSLEGNLYVKLTSMIPKIGKEKFKVWNWEGINLKVESQGKEKISTSVQYKVIQNIAVNEFDIIFNDDSSGEIADVITIVEKENQIQFEFYHCKYSSELVPGARVNDLYEVCGQAEKSIKWCQNSRKIIEHMIKRESIWNKTNYTRFDRGNLRKLNEIKNKLRDFKSSFKIYIVQPGLSLKLLSPDMIQIISGTSSYLMDTYGINLEIICSE